MANDTRSDPLRILVLSPDIDAGEHVTTALRQDRRPVRLRRFQKVDELLDFCEGKADHAGSVSQSSGLSSHKLDAWDVLLVACPPHSAEVVRKIKKTMDEAEAALALVPWVDSFRPETAIEYWGMGCQAIALRDSVAHTKAVLLAQMDHANRMRAYRQMLLDNKALTERCASLMHEAPEAIAYFHEGLYLHGNNAWIKEMRAEADDDLAGASLLEWAGSDEDIAGQIRDLIRASRHAGQGPTPPQDWPVQWEDESSVLHKGTLSVVPAEYDGEFCLQATFVSDTPALPGPSGQSEEVNVRESSDGAAAPFARDVSQGLPHKGAPSWFGKYAKQPLTVKDGDAGTQRAALVVLGFDHQTDCWEALGLEGAKIWDESVSEALLESLRTAGASAELVVGKDEQGGTGNASPDVNVIPFGDQWLLFFSPQFSERTTKAVNHVLSRLSNKPLDVGEQSMTVRPRAGGAWIDESDPLLGGLWEQAWKSFAKASASERATWSDPNAEVVHRRAEATELVKRVERAVQNKKIDVQFQEFSILTGNASIHAVRGMLPADGEHKSARLPFTLPGHHDALFVKILALSLDAALGAKKDRKTSLAITVSPAILLHVDAVLSAVSEKLKAHGVWEQKTQDPSLFLFVPASQASTRIKNLGRCAKGLAEGGVAVGLADVALASSSLSMLKQIKSTVSPPAIILAPKDLVGLSDDEEKCNVLRSLVSLMNEHHGQVWADGVADASSLALLYQMGVPVAKGPFLGDWRPTLG